MPANRVAQIVIERRERAKGNLIAALGRRPMSPEELAESLGKPLQRITYHYQVLEQTGGLSAPGQPAPQ